MACKWVRFAYRVLPLPAWRAFLLDRHIDRCPRCQAQALDLPSVRRLAVGPDALAGEPPLRPFAGEVHPAGACASILIRRYAFGFLLAMAIGGGAFILWRAAPHRPLPQGSVAVVEDEATASRFAVLGARIGGEPARPVIFKPGQPGMTIVWFEKGQN